ncbi:MAG: hypothetical protein JKY17_04360 [Magnetovibrio sp.]|nr:hypothetical protein [Magnetovibrio sp.]
MNFKKTIISMAMAFSLMLGLSACGDNTQNLQKSADLIFAQYKEHPPSRGWKVLSVHPDAKNNKLLVQILVTAQQDVNKLKSISRMDQLVVAKISCPKASKELSASLGSDTRIWIELRTNHTSLITSLCPK